MMLLLDHFHLRHLRRVLSLAVITRLLLCRHVLLRLKPMTRAEKYIHNNAVWPTSWPPPGAERIHSDDPSITLARGCTIDQGFQPGVLAPFAGVIRKSRGCQTRFREVQKFQFGAPQRMLQI